MQTNVIVIDDESVRPVDISSWIGVGNTFSAIPQSVRDVLAERISLSPHICSLLPSNTTPVSDLLQFKSPRLVDGLQTVSPSSCFSDVVENKTLVSLLQDDVPSPKFVSQLRSAAGQAILDGKNSIRDWRHSGVFLPLEAISLWQSLATIIQAQKAWIRARGWLEEQVRRKPELEEHRCRVERVLLHAPWNQPLSSLGNFITSRDTAVLLSNEWIDDGLIDTMLHRISARLRTINPGRAEGVLVATHTLASAIIGYGSDDPAALLSNELKRCRAHLMEHPRGAILTIAYSEPNHWAAFVIDPARQLINYGDSLGRQPPRKLIPQTKIWLKTILPSTAAFKHKTDLLCASQDVRQDSYSCGVIAINSLKHALFGDRLWCLAERERIRIEEFLGILEFAYPSPVMLHSSLSASQPSTESPACPPPPSQSASLSTILQHMPLSVGSILPAAAPPGPSHVHSPIASLSAPQLLSKLPAHLPPPSRSAPLSMIPQGTPSSTTSVLPAAAPPCFLHINSPIASSPHPSPPSLSAPLLATPNPATHKQLNIHPFFVRGAESMKRKFGYTSTGSFMGSHVKKRAVSTPTPSASLHASATISQKILPLGDSSSAVNKRALNNAVTAGTFIWDLKKLANYKARLNKIDAGYELDETEPKLARTIRHVHCGKRLLQSTPYEVYNYLKHVSECNASGSRDLATANVRTLDVGMQFLVPRGESFNPSTQSLDIAKTIKLWPCPGITEKDDAKIKTYLARTSVISAGGLGLHGITEKMFKKSFKDLTEKEARAVRDRQQHTHTWQLYHSTQAIRAIGLENGCLQNVELRSEASEPEACSACRALLKSRAFRNAINKPIPDDKNRVYVPHLHQNAAIGQMYTKFQGLRNLFEEKTDRSDIFLRYAHHVAEGKFDKNPVFNGLIEVMVQTADREGQGKGMQNIYYPPGFDEWCHEMEIVSPEASRTFKKNFKARTERSWRSKRSKAPPFHQGFGAHTLRQAQTYLIDYQYPVDAPLALAVDDTKLTPSFRPYFDAEKDKYFIVGGTGEPFEVVDVDNLHKQLEDAAHRKADKLRLWSLQIPLPGVPPVILAVLPIAPSMSAIQLAELDLEVLDLLLQASPPFCVVSLASDGTVVEREARREPVRMGRASVIQYRIPHPALALSAVLQDNGSSDCCQLVFELLRMHGRPIAIIQDSKHLRKTFRNNIFSGARLLLLGRYPLFYEQVRDIAFDPKERRPPIRNRDVEKVDRQDDWAAARLFSASTLEYMDRYKSDDLGLQIFLFVFGELVDAYQNRNISHLERVKMVLRAKFFNEKWKNFLKEAGYPQNRYYLSPECDDICNILINGLLGLIFVYRDHLGGDFPLLPWLFGTEGIEHIFGLIRCLVPDFTFLDTLLLARKISVRLRAACRARGMSTGNSESRKSAEGYSNSYMNGEGMPSVTRLSAFPTDKEIADAAAEAYDEACTLWTLLGYMGTTPTPSASTNLESEAKRTVDEELEEVEAEEIEEDVDASDREVLETTLQEAYSLHGLSPSANTELDECAFAAASLSLGSIDAIDRLPDDDSDAIEEIRKMLSVYLSNIASASASGAQKVNQLILQASTAPALALPTDGNVMGSGSGTCPSFSAPQSLVEVSESTDLSALITIRRSHETKEAADAVGNKLYSSVMVSETKNRPAEMHDNSAGGNKLLTDRQLLTRRIHDIIKADSSERGISTGLNRSNRWTKSAAGSSMDAKYAATTGNTKNAQLAARGTASGNIKARFAAFAKLTLGADLATAKMDLLSELKKFSWGICCIDGELMLVQVITMYERGGGKAGKHGWVSSSSSIGALSYIVVQTWQHAGTRQRQFLTYHGKTKSLCMPRFAHVPAFAFLYHLPDKSVKIPQQGNQSFVQMNGATFESIYSQILSQKDQIVQAVHKLLHPPKARKL